MRRRISRGTTLDLLRQRNLRRRGLLQLDEVRPLFVHPDDRSLSIVELYQRFTVLDDQPATSTARRALDRIPAHHHDGQVTQRAQPGLTAIRDLVERAPKLTPDAPPDARRAGNRASSSRTTERGIPAPPTSS